MLNVEYMLNIKHIVEHIIIALALLRNIQNIRICMGKKPIVSLTYENERISIKNSLPYLKCVLRVSCVVHVRADLWPFYGFLCKRFSLYINLYI